jgi:hypothetical protein
VLLSQTSHCRITAYTRAVFKHYVLAVKFICGKEVTSNGDVMPKKLTVLIKDELDEKFRETVFKTKGMHKGNITAAVEEALESWVRKKSEEK